MLISNNGLKSMFFELKGRRKSRKPFILNFLDKLYSIIRTNIRILYFLIFIDFKVYLL